VHPQEIIIKKRDSQRLPRIITRPDLDVAGGLTGQLCCETLRRDGQIV
jgi:hypothetical protein